MVVLNYHKAFQYVIYSYIKILDYSFEEPKGTKISRIMDYMLTVIVKSTLKTL